MQVLEIYPTDTFSYRYLAGPVEAREDLEQGVVEGNCRFALQLYFYRIHGLFLEKDEIYLPGGYASLGTFVFQEEPIEYGALKAGDIVYAQNLRNKEGKELDKGIEHYQNKDEWLYHLHSAIWLGKVYGETDVHYIWHATHIDGGPSVWPLEKFEQYYKPISVKRVV